MRTISPLVLAVLASHSLLTAQEVAPPDMKTLQAKLAASQSKLERLVELRIRLDLGIQPTAGEIAALIGLHGFRDPKDAEKALATEERRLAASRQHLSDLSRGVPEAPHDERTAVAPAPDVSTPERESRSTDPDEDPTDTRPAETRAARRVPASRPGIEPVQIDPGKLRLGAILVLLEADKQKEAAAALDKLETTQAGMREFVAGLCAERAGDLEGAERQFQAASQKVQQDHSATGFLKSFEESVQLALDHVKFKRERLQWKPPVSGK